MTVNQITKTTDLSLRSTNKSRKGKRNGTIDAQQLKKILQGALRSVRTRKLIIRNGTIDAQQIKLIITYVVSIYLEH